jgi:glycosyltransferase involved in cell wall biosynthesis
MNIILKGQLSYMNQYYDVVGVTSYDPKHFEDIKVREGIRMKIVNMTRSISPFKDLKSLWQLYRLFKSERPHIVHTHTPKAGLLGMIASRMARVPVRLHTVGGMPLMEINGSKRILLNMLERLTYGLANKVYPNSKGLEQFIIQEKFCARDKVQVLANGGSNGVNTDFFRPDFDHFNQPKKISLRKDIGIDKNDFVFFFCGRIAKEKGIAELLEAFEALQKQHENIKLLLIGLLETHYGTLSPEVIVKLKENNAIIHPGRADDVRPYYAISDVFVLPTYREGFPNAVLEAGAMGLPQIVTDINGCNEIVEHNVNGLIIPVKDSGMLYESMKNLIENHALRSRLADNARKVIFDKFRCEFVWNAMKDEYDRF